MNHVDQKRELIVIASGELDINMESVVNAPREFVYRAHSDPLLIPKWWGPAKYETTVEEMDFRPGGKWCYIQRDQKGTEHVFFGEYREIIPLEKITWTFRYEPYPDVSIETVEFIELNTGQTKLRVRSIYPSKESRDAVLKSGMESGYSESLDRLETLNSLERKKTTKKSHTSKKSTKTLTTEKSKEKNGKIILYMTMTLDGYVSGPNNELDWMMKTMGTDQEEVKDNLEILKSFDVGIMGYPTFAGMAPFWENVIKDPQSSTTNRDIANIVTKYYAYALSTKEEKLPNNNSELILIKNDDDIIKAVNSIKQKEGGNIGIAGGVRTAQKLSKLGLINEYILTIHPVVIGSGKPLFTTKIDLELESSKTYKNGVIRSKYRPK